MLKELLREQMQISGYTRDKLAQEIKSRPAQIGYLLADGKDDVTLSISQFEKLMNNLGIGLDANLRRIVLAKEIANTLVDRKKKTEEVAEWDKRHFIEETGKTELEGLPEFSLEEWGNMYDSKLVDLEGTFPAFKSLVQKYMKIFETGRRSATPKTVEDADDKLFVQHKIEERKGEANSMKASNAALGESLVELLGGCGILAVATSFLMSVSKNTDSNLSKDIAHHNTEVDAH